MMEEQMMISMMVDILITALFLGLIPAIIAHKKGYNFLLWWFCGWMLWIVVLPWSICMKARYTCPYCKEVIKKGAEICIHCKKDLKK